MRSQGAYNVVIVARNFNPTIFSQLWLVKHEIFSEKDVQEQFVFTPMVVSVTTPEVNFLGVPDRIQLGFANDKLDSQGVIERILGRIVKELPHTPFQAIGFNLAWTISPKNPKEFQKLNKTFCPPKNNPLTKYFVEPDCRHGSYLSKNVPMGQLRLEIKPVIVPDSPSSSEAIQLAFNFNRDLPEGSKPSQIHEFLASWDDAFSMSLGMVEAIDKEWNN